MPDTSTFAPQPTADGSFTFFSEKFGEAFHSRQGAKTEAQLKFVETCQLAQKARQQPVLRLLDVCYGLGYNSAAALEAIWASNPHCRVELVALELDPTVPQTAIAHQLLKAWSPPIPDLLTVFATALQVQTERFQGQLYLEDARISIQQLHRANFQADAIFLDPFSPRRCPQLWTVEFLREVAGCCAPTGRLATYSCAAAVRSALVAAGFAIGSIHPVGDRHPGTLASFNSADFPPLSRRAREHLQTRAAIPYRDPHLCDPASAIWQRRQEEQQASTLEPASQWKKRWLESQIESEPLS